VGDPQQSQPRSEHEHAMGEPALLQYGSDQHDKPRYDSAKKSLPDAKLATTKLTEKKVCHVPLQFNSFRKTALKTRT
jgi:hypothetical protein